MSNNTNQGKWSHIEPTDDDEGIWVPELIRQSILLHIIKNSSSKLNSSLFLSVQGPAGEGKSFMTRVVCSRLGLIVVPISGSILSGSHEKEPVQLFESVYQYASSLRSHYNILTVILIDDFDLSVASAIQGRRYTVNSQLLAGFFMNLADDPLRCGSQNTNRIPIIMTGNNFQNLPPPLTRHGRMTFCEWKPSVDDKLKIISHIFGPTIASAHIEELIAQYPDQSISFFASLKDDLVNDVIVSFFDKKGQINLIDVDIAIDSALGDININKLYKLADKRSSQVATNYL